MKNIVFDFTNVNWAELLISLLFIPAGLKIINWILSWWKNSRPGNRLLNRIRKQQEPCRIFVREIFIEDGTTLHVIEPTKGIGTISNIRNLFPEAEGKGIAYIFNVLGKVGKTENIELIGLGDDFKGEWNSNLILLGAQAQKHFDFYQLMENVAYRVDENDIINNQNGKAIPREKGFGYGIILKANNPYYEKKGGNALLLGGYGVLGTLAASYYFKQHYLELGKKFGNDCFGVVVRAPLSAGAEAVERLEDYDYQFRRESWSTIIKNSLFGISKVKKEPSTEIRDNGEIGITDFNSQESREVLPSGISTYEKRRKVDIDDAIASEHVTSGSSPKFHADDRNSGKRKRH